MKSIKEISDIELEHRKTNPECYVALADILPGEQLPLVLDAIRRQAIEETIRRSEDKKRLRIGRPLDPRALVPAAEDVIDGILSMDSAVQMVRNRFGFPDNATYGSSLLEENAQLIAERQAAMKLMADMASLSLPRTFTVSNRSASSVLAQREEAAAKLASKLAAPGADWSFESTLSTVNDDLLDAMNYSKAQIATAMAIPRDKLNTAPDWLQTGKTETSAPEPAVLNLNAKRNIRLE